MMTVCIIGTCSELRRGGRKGGKRRKGEGGREEGRREREEGMGRKGGREGEGEGGRWGRRERNIKISSFYTCHKLKYSKLTQQQLTRYELFTVGHSLPHFIIFQSLFARISTNSKDLKTQF